MFRELWNTWPRQAPIKCVAAPGTPPRGRVDAPRNPPPARGVTMSGVGSAFPLDGNCPQIPADPALALSRRIGCRWNIRVMGIHGTSGAGIIVAVAGQDLTQEAVAVVAASGHEPVQVTTPDAGSQVWRRATAVLLDVPTAHLLLRDSGAAAVRREGLFVIHEDGEEPDLRTALEIGAEGAFALPSEGADLVEWIGRPGRPGSPGTGGGGTVIACIGAVGGAGTSVVAAACAAAMAQRQPGGGAMLIDADELSGGADLLLGIEHVQGLRWPDIRTGARGGSIDAEALRTALPYVSGGPADSLRVITGPRSRATQEWVVEPTAVRSVTDAVVGSGGSVVIDLPRSGTSGDLLPPRTDLVALVVPTTVRGIAAASDQAHRLRTGGVEPVVVLTGTSGSGVTADDAEYATGTEVIASVPFIRRLEREIESTGLGGRNLRRLVDAVSPILDGVAGLASDGGWR